MAELKLVGLGLRAYGDIIFNTDGAYDIGKSGATRPRDLFLSRNALIGGTLGVTGAISTTSSSMTITPSTATNGAYTVFTNTGGNYYVGVDDSAGAVFASGAYNMVLYTPAGLALKIDPVTARITVPQAATFGSSLAITGALTGVTTLAASDTITVTNATSAELRLNNITGDALNLLFANNGLTCDFYDTTNTRYVWYYTASTNIVTFVSGVTLPGGAISYGANDSAGAGYRLVRVPNV